MKTFSLFVLITAAAAAIAFLTGYTSVGATFIGLGIATLGAADYSRTRKPLVPVTVAAANREAHPLAA